MDGWIAIFISVPLLIAASFAGGSLPGLLRASHLRFQLTLSFVSGLMLGVALLHLLPHAVHELGSVDRAAALSLVGVIAVFLLIRFLHVHSNVEPHGEHGTHGQGGAVRWGTLLAGMALHSIVDGAALASAVRIESGSPWPGLLVLVVILLHKPIDALAITSQLPEAKRRRRVNLLFALIAPAAAVVAYSGFLGMGEAGHGIAGGAMAFCAGAFLCVALADLMPEVQFHAHNRLSLTVALALGVGVAVLLGLAEGEGHGLHDHGAATEPGHSHDHE